MGADNSKQVYTHLLLNLLKARGAKVGKPQLEKFLDFIEKICPWFPEEGTVSLKTWEEVRVRLQGHFEAHGPEKIPVDTFALWTLIRDSLDPCHEGIRGQEDSTGEKVKLEEESGSRPDPVAPTAPPPSFRLYEKVALDEELDPQDKKDLDKKVTRYHNPNFDNPQLFLAQENLKQNSPKIKSNLKQPKTESKSPRPPPSTYTSLVAQMREMKRKMAEMEI